MDSPGPEIARLGGRVRLALVALAMALPLVFAAVSTTPSQRTDALSRLNALNFKESLTHAGEVAQTPPPSPSVILKTYRPTSAPTEEKSESLPNKKSSSKPGERAGKPFLPSFLPLTFLFLFLTSPHFPSLTPVGTFVLHEVETGNTPPPSPSVILYTYQPTKAPTEEKAEEDAGVETGLDTVVVVQSTTKDDSSTTKDDSSSKKDDSSTTKDDSSSKKDNSSTTKDDSSSEKTTTTTSTTKKAAKPLQ